MARLCLNVYGRARGRARPLPNVHVDAGKAVVVSRPRLFFVDHTTREYVHNATEMHSIVGRA